MSKLSILKEFADFLFSNKKWWVVVAAVFLILLGALLYLAEGSAVAPLIYTIF
ncbi:MAG: hypothetical protein HYW80_00830 [Parcubacteria group bacterium]|nr:hypothetical protein [Parcubacteria group bacterium]